MIYKRYSFLIILQVILIALTSAAFVWTLSQEYLLVTRITLCIIWIIEIIYLIWYLHKNERQTVKFLQSFKYQDGSLSFGRRKSKSSYSKLYSEFEEIIRSFEKVKVEKEKEHLFFDHIIQHAATGLLATDDAGKVLLHNKSFLSIFKIQQIGKIQSLDKIRNGLSNLLLKMKPDKQEVIKIGLPNNILQLSVRASVIRSEGQLIRIYSFQDIKTEIEHGEIEAWQKLIRILNHEIMNSVSPINLLTTSLIDLWQNQGSAETSTDIIQQSIKGLEVIRKRSRGLTQFVESYRDATRIPEPRFQQFRIFNIFEQIKTLLGEELESHNIKLSYATNPNDLTLFADEKLVEQVIINLVKNSAQALVGRSDPSIELSSKKETDATLIYIKDNGIGIPDKINDQIFTPFFTTREGGSGIGLSLSRQIMRMHEGSIDVQSEEGVGTVVVLRF